MSIKPLSGGNSAAARARRERRPQRWPPGAGIADAPAGRLAAIAEQARRVAADGHPLLPAPQRLGEHEFGDVDDQEPAELRHRVPAEILELAIAGEVPDRRASVGKEEP